MSELLELLDCAVAAALPAGQDILDVYNTDFAVERKEDGSALTEADKRAHARIESLLEKTGIPILSEEGEEPIPYETRKDWKSLWIVDPLDGTDEFRDRNGEFTVNIALVREHRPVLGVVYVPVTKTLYFGGRELGAFKMTDCASNLSPAEIAALKSKAVRLPVPGERQDFVVIVSRRNSSPATEEYINRVQVGRQIVRKSVGSSIKLCAVAEGVADIYPRFQGTREWDTAAGQAVVEAAGGRVIDWATGQDMVYNRPNLLNSHFVVFRNDRVRAELQGVAG